MRLQFLRYLTILFFFTNCTVNYGQLSYVKKLSSDLKEVSGVEHFPNSELLWMINDSGNDPKVFALNTKGKIQSTLYIDGKNRDWEDLTTDNKGNLYVGDFGNNANDRKNLKVYVFSVNNLDHKKNIEPKVIKFSFPNQKKFPPKKKNRYFDVESFFHYNGYLYLFTKSRVKKNYGITDVYKIPATAGKHKARLVTTFHTCDEMSCWVTSADISPDGKKVVLLSHSAIWQFTDFKGDNFMNGKMKKFDLGHESQKEGVCFRDNNSVYITDEKSHGSGGNLYVFTLD
ncbi:hypothetical protein [uncultured Kordia sp.]|uniref:hypothetical protein n=1 Tax=uncultured Kordia sp. TaxID=507699 RepID=UPI0026040D61|nr:hypothetical protein [uncultured Kordia sp.]